jgi:hypothetical protein
MRVLHGDKTKSDFDIAFWGYDRRIPLSDPRFVLDRSHRHVLEFTFRQGYENEFTGDYAGYAQEYLEQAHPEAVALFMNGCGADQNPHPRRDMVPGIKPLEMAQHQHRF